MKRSARTATVAAGMALSLTLAACGDDGDDGDTGDNIGQDSESELSGDPIRIFTIQQLTVTNQDATDEAADALMASVERINADGGIDGRPVEVEVCDDNFTAAIGAECAREAVEGEYVAVVGTVTQQGDTIYPVLEQAGVCNLAPFPINRLDYSSPMSYPIIAGGPINVAGYPYALKAVGSTEIGVAFVDVPTAAAVVPFVEMGAEAAGGVTINQQVPIPITTTDISAVVASTIRDNDGAALLVQPGGLASFLQSLSQQGSDVKVAASAADDSLLEQLGDAADNLVISSAYASTSSESEGIEQFNADMEDQAPDAERNAFAVNAYLGAQALKQVIEDAELETIDNTTVCEALTAATDIDLLGFAPQVSFDMEFPIPGLNRIFNPYVQVQQVEDGTLVAVDEEFFNPLDPDAEVPPV